MDKSKEEEMVVSKPVDDLSDKPIFASIIEDPLGRRLLAGVSLLTLLIMLVMNHDILPILLLSMFVALGIAATLLKYVANVDLRVLVGDIYESF